MSETTKLIAVWPQESVWTTDTSEAKRIDEDPLSGPERHHIIRIPANWTEEQIDQHIAGIGVGIFSTLTACLFGRLKIPGGGQ